MTSRLIESRGLLEQIEIVHAPTDQDIRDKASCAHVAIPFMQRFGADFFSPELTPKLRLVVQFGVGLEGVDIGAASENGIAVSNVPGSMSGNAEATSEHAVFLLTSMLRHLNDLPRRFSEKCLGGLPVPRSIYGKRVTVVGFGAVGSVLCKYLVTMGAHVTAVRRNKWDDINDDNLDSQTLNSIERAQSLEEALPGADAVILACALTPETYQIVNESAISLLPRHAVIINVGRGPLVSYSAISDALNTGYLSGYASDVGIGDTPEPFDPNDNLAKHPNVIFTPHVGGITDYSHNKMAEIILDSIESVIGGKQPSIWVNRPGV
uniref:D-isomer specific 2-hydroxyacid dehydrogenase NAD-binding domain-containing protein n=1 Tax=Corethron hystrix TaxID=216773 RepID=A0A7S1BY12_9STRA